jgi:hypothetical protein
MHRLLLYFTIKLQSNEDIVHSLSYWAVIYWVQTNLINYTKQHVELQKATRVGFYVNLIIKFYKKQTLFYRQNIALRLLVYVDLTEINLS